MSKKVSFEDFYQAVGRANSHWVSVEDAMRDVFSRLVICTVTGGSMLGVSPNSYWIMGNIFYSTTNHRARLSMISQIMERVIDEPGLKAEWNAVQNRLLTLYKRRNILAHGTVWGNQETGASHIAASLFSSGRDHMDYARVCACTESFSRMARRLENLAIALNRHLAGLPKGGA